VRVFFFFFFFEERWFGNVVGEYKLKNDGETETIKNKESTAVVERCMQKHRVLADVNFEGLGGPAANGLDDMVGDTRLCQSSSASRAERVTGDLRGKVLAQASDEPRTGGDMTVRSKPELVVERKRQIANRDVALHGNKGVVRCRELL
jgi:hypothetical protein